MTALLPGGGYADYCVVDERNALPVPAGLTTIEAAGAPPPANGSYPNDRDAGSTTTDVLPESLGLNQTAATRQGSDDNAINGPAQLLPLNETSLPLVGTLLGVALLGTIGSALVFLGAEAHWDKAIQGAMILIAVASGAVRAKEGRHEPQ